MAGVAPSRSGTNATTIGMVVSIVVSVILAGVLIWLFTMQEELRNNTVQAQSEVSRLARPGDKSAAIQMFPDANQTGKTLVGEMTNGVRQLMAALAGPQMETPQTALDELANAVEELNKGANGNSLTAANGAVAMLRDLHTRYDQALKDRLSTQDALDKANALLEKERNTTTELKDKFDSELTKLASKVDELQKAKQDIEKLKSTDIEALAAKIDDARLVMNEMQRTHRDIRQRWLQERTEKERLLEEQRVALGSYRELPTSAEPMAIARKPIGQILRALPGDALVHIGLGREDGVTLGMTFSVYSSDERVPASGRGKASVEVVNVNRSTSECRVVSPPSPDDPILQGDYVGNLVLSRNRNKKTTFCVVGDFDIDFDGHVDVRGRDKIVALVRSWGGEVVESVTPLTDYVVAGAEPPGEVVVPGPVPADDEAAGEVEAAAAPEDDEAADEEASADEEDAEDEEAEDEESTDEESEDEESEDEESEDEEEPSEEEEEEEDEDEGDGRRSRSIRTRGGDGGVAMTPDRPVLERQPEIDPTAGPQKRRYVSEAERYREVLLRARSFSVPVLTQDVFYNYLGIEGTRSDVRRLQD